MGENQSKAYWQPDDDAPNCNLCGTEFTVTTRRHHCRNCGFIFCKKCSSHTCPITMRGILEPVRVCDSCFAALMASARGATAPPRRGGPGNDPLSRGTPAQRPPQEQNSAPAAAVGQSDAHPNPPNAVTQAGTPGGGDDQDRGPAARTLPEGPSQQQVEQERQQKQEDPNVPSSKERGEDKAVEAEEPGNDVYQDAYGSGQPQQSSQSQPQPHPPASRPNSNVSPEQLEREILARQWATVRQEAQFIDILVQRAEKVEPTSMVEYSRETESVTLQPEVSVQVLGSTVLPLPPPMENSARYLMEPVKLWTRNNSKQLFLLDAVAAAIAPKLQPALPQEAIRRACPTQFAES